MTPAVTILPSLSHNHELLEFYSPFIAQLLINRGITNIQEAEVFLKPQWENHYDPFLMKNVDQVINRIKQGIEKSEKITIYADYDADGIPGAVILSSLFDVIEYTNYEVYLPHRHDEGYGIHIEALEKIVSEGTTLVVTIDVGITGHDAALWAHKHSLDLIITDHHEPLLNVDGTQNLPEPLYLVNPKQEGCSYPDDMLCGSGVIFKVIQGFIRRYGEEYKIPEGWEKWLLDMVGLATISDMVPLVKENRIFAYYGMKVIPKTKRLGLKKILWESGLDMRYLTEEDIAFSVTPKLNAASRMSHPEDAYRALCAKTEREATDAVNHLKALNDERKKLVAQTVKQALGTLRERTLGPVIVIGNTGWQAGVLGLIASKLVEHFGVPSFVWSEEQGVIKGSCRSANGVDLVRLMEQADPDAFVQFGGHAEAGGFSCEKKEIHFLEERLTKAYETYMVGNGAQEETEILIDTELTLEEVTVESYQALRTLAPFGQGNPEPLFIFKNVIPVTVEQFGKEKHHLKLIFRDNGGRLISAIQFFADPLSMTTKPEVNVPCDLIAHMSYSVFRGKHELRLKIIDVR